MHTHANAFLKAIIMMLVEGHATFGDRKNAAFDLQQYQETIPITKKVNQTLYNLLMYNCDTNVFQSDKKRVIALLFEFITKHRDQCKLLIRSNLKGNSVINSIHEEYVTDTYNKYFKINPGRRERRQRKTAFKYTYHISTEEESSDSDFEKPEFNAKRSKTSNNHKTSSNSKADPGPDFTNYNSKPKTDYKSEPFETKTAKLKPKQYLKYTLKSFDPSFCFDEHRYNDLLNCNIDFDKDDVSLIECSLSEAYHKFNALKLKKLLLKYHPDKSNKKKYESISGSLISKIMLLKKHIQKNFIIYITSSDEEN